MHLLKSIAHARGGICPLGLVVFIFWATGGLPHPGHCHTGIIGGHIPLHAVFGITLNLITLFALVLAIGIVVDNAIGW